MYKKALRHGDVDLIPIDKIPIGALLQRNDVVMHGENGHEHKLINGQILLLDKRKFVQSGQKTYLVHQQHKQIPIPKGTFEIFQEQEFDPFNEVIQRVRD